MIPPASGREQDPALTQPPEETLPEPPAPLRSRRLSARGKMVFFGIFIGCAVCAGVSFLCAVLWISVVPRGFSPLDPHRGLVSEDTFFRVLVTRFVETVHWYILIGVIAAAAQAMMRQTDRAARARRRSRRTEEDSDDETPDSDRRASDIVRDFSTDPQQS
jgi:hypothetical protein